MNQITNFIYICIFWMMPFGFCFDLGIEILILNLSDILIKIGAGILSLIDLVYHINLSVRLNLLRTSQRIDHRPHLTR
jgi:hypothetical protein